MPDGGRRHRQGPVAVEILPSAPTMRPSSASASSSSSGSSKAGTPTSAPALSAEDVSLHEASLHDASLQEAVPQAVVAHDAVVHEKLDHQASLHEASLQDASLHEADARAAFAHEAASKTGSDPPFGSCTTNCSSARFGLGGETTNAAAGSLTTPTPSEPGAAAGVGFAVSMSAPLIWSGVQPG